MKKHLMITLALVCALAAPTFAMKHSGHDMAGHTMEDKGHSMNDTSMNHDGMDASGEMVMLGTKNVDGMEAAAHLKDVRAAMAKMNMAVTHHFMIMVKDQHQGTTVDEGTVALKIKGPDGTTGNAIKLMGMGGHFGADIELKQAGMYTFIVGSKLADGAKRTWEFSYHLN